MSRRNPCTRYQDWIQGLQTAGGDDTLPRELLEHLGECPPCREENEAYQATLQQLGEWEPLEPPRHFFVYEEARGSLLSRGWRIFFSPHTLAVVSSLLLVVTLSAMAARVQFRSDGASLTIGLGTLPVLAQPSPERDPEFLRADLQGWLAAELSTRDEHVLKVVRDEISSLSNRIEQTQKERFNQALTAFDERLGQEIQQRDELLTDTLRNAALEIYRTLSTQQQQDLRNLNARLRVVEAAGQIQGDQTEVLVATVLELARRQE